MWIGPNVEQLTRHFHPAEPRPVRIVQFGEGNFLRSFVDDFLQILNDRHLIDMNVAVVQPLPEGRVEALRTQDGLYTLFLEGIRNGQVVKQHRIIDVLSQFVDPHRDLSGYLALARNPEIRIVFSNTTEAGIAFEEEILEAGKLPHSFPGKLLLFLRERYEAFGGSSESGLEIVPCELIDHNGDTLREVLVRLAGFNRMEEDFLSWLVGSNRFCNTLVDRIVPGYPREDASRLQEELGYFDNSMVKGEIFHLWVIDGQTSELRKLLPFEAAGIEAHYVESIVPYKLRKVKILNGCHTCLVPIATQLGFSAVRESVEDPRLSAFLDGFVFSEVVPTIPLPEADMDAFAKSVFERYRNPFIHHLLMSIALNGVSKYKARVLPTILDLHARGKSAPHALFSLAALIVFYRGIGPDGKPVVLQEEERFLTLFRKLWAAGDPETVARAFLSLPYWETDLLSSPEVSDIVVKWTGLMVRRGMKAALEAFLEGNPDEQNVENPSDGQCAHCPEGSEIRGTFAGNHAA